MVVRLASILIINVLLSYASFTAAAAMSMAKPNCADKCGEVTIPYPFGIGPASCFLDEWYEVVCEANNTTPRLKKLDLEVLSITIAEDRLQSKGTWNYYSNIIRVNLPITYSSTTNCTQTLGGMPTTLAGSNFYFSDGNKFMAVGCDMTALLNDTYSASIVGCKSECNNNNNKLPNRFGECLGPDGCCQTTTIPPNLQDFNINLDKSIFSSSEQCGDTSAFLVDSSWFVPNVTDLHSLLTVGNKKVPVTLNWGIPDDSDIGIDLTTSRIDDFYDNDGYSYVCYYNTASSYSYIYCQCWAGFAGNPYLVDGCQDINECEDTELIKHNLCGRKKCINKRGGYSCVDQSKIFKLLLIALGGGVEAVILFVVGRWIYKLFMRNRKQKLKSKFFKRNGGLLLQKQLANSPETSSSIGKSRLFTSKELSLATDRFNPDRILGRGGQGTVYKGMLTDGRIVAVKKSVMLDEVDENDVQHFINEIYILSQINHRNVVKLLGCCLETEVPLLVYEFIPNGTLYKYLHDSSDADCIVSWEVRLRIASEVAGALSYLHVAASIPIFHRDIKTTNILLDEKNRAKVADFAISRLVSVDTTHLTTSVQGTFGYLDPEYFQSSQFSDKSDVYSFGVVLVELLTRQKPICSLREHQGRSLATYFIMSMKKNCLLEILDPHLLLNHNGNNREQMMAVADLAKRCLSLNGRKRPTMKQVALELEWIKQIGVGREINNNIVVDYIGETSYDDKGFTLTEAEACTISLSDSLPRLPS